MKFALPASSRRRYLTGIDWSIGMLDAMTRHRTGAGNLSQIILHISGRLEVEPLHAALRAIAQRLPLIHGRVSRDWINLCPYWYVPKPRDDADIPVAVTDLAPGESDRAEQLLHEHVNTDLARLGPRLSFHLVRMGEAESRLGMVFDHRLLDAAGAELFIDMLDRTYRGELPQIAEQINQTEPARLDCWGRQFAAGRAVNGFRLKVSQQDVAALVMPSPQRDRPYRFLFASVPETAIDKLSEQASAESGAPLLLPSIVARAAKAFAPLLGNAPLPGQQQLITVALNTRPNDTSWNHLFFNHLSFLMFGVPIDQAHEVASVARAVGQQFLEQMRDDMPGALANAAMLTRICPHVIGHRLARMPLKGRVCSFYLAFLPQPQFNSSTFLGLRIINLVHTPRVPPPPGIGLCLARFGEQWNLTLSWLDGVMHQSDAAHIIQRFHTLLEQRPT